MKRHHNIEVGQSALEVIGKFPTIFPEVTSFTLTSYSPSPGLEERLRATANGSLLELFKNAQKIRSEYVDLPYWESILLTARNPADIEIVIKNAIHHEIGKDNHNRVSVKKQDFTLEHLYSRRSALSPARSLAICSLVKKEKSTESFHIPLMDLRCIRSAENLEKCKLAFQQFGISGVLIESGRSYHFYGFQLLSQEEWIQFMAKCLLLAPLSDVRYVGHRLMEGACDLRITEIADKFPKVIAFT